MGSRIISTVLRTGTGCLSRYTPAQRLAVPLLHVYFTNATAKKSRNMSYTAVERGSPNTPDYRLFIKNGNGEPVSPFHDIPLEAGNETFNMVVEIPRWSNAKMEVCKEEKLNPIKQDVKKGKLRFVKNIFPHKGYIWNYGALPQTYEDPEHTTEDTGTKGDSDPIDVCEIGYKIHERGAVIQVKPVGIMCLIDEGETDWKVLAIDVTDPMADQLNDIGDVEEKFPGLIRATYEWFKYYKVPDGKPVNEFAFEGKAKDKSYTLKVISETHDQWKALVAGSGESSIARANSAVKDSPHNISSEEAAKILEDSPKPGDGEPMDQEVNKWHYVIPQN